MGLPSPKQLLELARIIETEQSRARMGVYDQLRELGQPGYRPPVPEARPTADKAANYAKKGAQFGGRTLASTATSAVATSGLKVGTTANVGGLAVPLTATLAPVGAALSAWIGVATVAVQASKVFDLYAIRDDARSSRRDATRYYCACKTCCAPDIQYIIDKKERNTAVVAVSVGTFGVASLGKALHSAGKRLKSAVLGETRPKEEHCRKLVGAARAGCPAAMATIFLLSGSWTQGYRDKKTMEAAVLTIMAEDGWKKLKDNF